MKWRDADCDGSSYVAIVGPYEFQVYAGGNNWWAEYGLVERPAAAVVEIGKYATEKQAKTYAYRRARALVERMVREVRDS